MQVLISPIWLRLTNTIGLRMAQPPCLTSAWSPRVQFCNRESKGEAVQAYLQLLQSLLEHGVRKEDRTGTGTLSLFGHQLRFDLSQGFPLLTTKKLHTRSIFHELLWFLRGG